jgi:glycosyltransferase involved in cell wall biosynthesis
MRERLGLHDDAVRVVSNGLHLGGYEDEPRPRAERGPPTVGYLARMCRDKGLHTLVEAFIDLGRRPGFEDLRLRIVGVQLAEDAPYVRGLEQDLRDAGLAERVSFHPNVSREEKLAHLRAFHVLSVPATYGESFGLYLLEALASGVPVVQPRHGGFPEVVEGTEGGILCEPDDAVSLADGLAALLGDEARWSACASAGRRAVLDRFHSARMAEEFLDVCDAAARAPRTVTRNS